MAALMTPAQSFPIVSSGLGSRVLNSRVVFSSGSSEQPSIMGSRTIGRGSLPIWVRRSPLGSRLCGRGGPTLLGPTCLPQVRSTSPVAGGSPLPVRGGNAWDAPGLGCPIRGPSCRSPCGPGAGDSSEAVTAVARLPHGKARLSLGLAYNANGWKFRTGAVSVSCLHCGTVCARIRRSATIASIAPIPPSISRSLTTFGPFCELNGWSCPA